MTENTTLTSSNHDLGTVQRPHLTGKPIQDTGLTLLASGGPSSSFDIVLVHGLQGHPEKTWCYHQRPDHTAVKRDVKKSKLRFWKDKAEKAGSVEAKTTSEQDDETTYKRDENTKYWPTDLLAPDFPAARIFTYGYDSRVSHFFNGPANQNTITDNGRALLSSIASQRQHCAGRPLLLIVHSLGGILVKSALRLSASADDRDADLRDVYQSTFAIMFFGTPHRGSDWTDVGHIARRFAAVLGFSSSDYNLRALQSNNEILQILRDDFARMLGKEAFYITSFQESKGFKGVRGLDDKIVESDSSGLDHIFERKIPINANHLDMCKFGINGPTRNEYDEKVHPEIVRHWRRVSKKLGDQETVIASSTTSRNIQKCKDLLDSLESAEISRRYNQIGKADNQTFEWLFQKSELGFTVWLESGTGLYWCRGHPATGKSTLMKWIYADSRTIQVLDLRVGRKIKASFFFHDRGAELQKSFKGLLQGIVHQILQGAPELLPIILPVREQIIKRSDTSWTEEDTHKAFRIILEQQMLPLDITLFLDALDEYTGTPESIATFLYNITNAKEGTQTKIRVCFSSRPLQIFLDTFGGVPGFDIHDHTDADIKLVIRSMMSQNPRMCQSMQSTTIQRQLAQKFADEISLRAEGMFLWVKLVLDELLPEFTNGESLHDLINKLVILPRTLEEFFQHTLDRLPDQYRTDAKVIFEVLRCAIHPLRVHDFFEICRCTRAKLLVDCPPCTVLESQWSHEGVDRWIRSRTGGLVQLVPLVEEDYEEGKSEEYYCPVPLRLGQSASIVQFLHQTVKTFSRSSPWPTHPVNDRFPCHNGHAYIVRYILALLFQHPHSDSDVIRRSRIYDKGEKNISRSATSKHFFWVAYGASYLIEDLLRLMQLAEAVHPRILFDSLLEFGDSRITDLFDNWMWTHVMQEAAFDSVWAVAVVCDLCELLEALYEREEGKQADVNSQSLLNLAVTERPSWLSVFDAEKRVRTIRILMDHGADPTKSNDGETPYERLCKLAFENKSSSYSHSPRIQLLTIITPLLQGGQSPNGRIKFQKLLSNYDYKADQCLFRNAEQCLLHYAAENADRDLVYALLEHGAEINPLDTTGSTPLDCACDGSRHPTQEQLSDLIDQYLNESLESQPSEDLRRRLQVASLLIARGGGFGIPTPDADIWFREKRRPVTQNQVKALRRRGIEVDDRIVWSSETQISSGSQTQISGGIANLLLRPFGLYKKYIGA